MTGVQTCALPIFPLGEKYSLVTGKGVAVATVAAPEEDAAAATEGSAATPDVIAKGKKEEDAAKASAKAPAKAPAKK